MKTGWADDVALELGLNELNYDQLMNGHVVVHIQCRACTETFEVHFSKRLPPGVLKKKLQERGFDTRRGKTRCSNCVKINRTATRENITVRPSNQHIVEEAKMRLPRLGQNKAMALTIPNDNELFQRFVDENLQSRNTWTAEYITNRDGELQLVLTPWPLLEGKVRGQARGGVQKSTGSFLLQISASMIKGSHMVDPYSSGPTELISNSAENLIFSVPTKPRQAAAPDEKPKQEAKPITELAPAPSEPEPPAPVTKDTLKEIITQPPPQQISSPIDKDMIGIYHAVDVLNAYKNIMGDKMSISVNENGYINVLAQYGPD